MHPEPCSLYQGLVENSPDVIWQTDRELRFSYISPAVNALFGYTPEELMGRSLSELLSMGSRDFIRSRLSARVADEQSGKKIGHRLLEIQIINKAGLIIPAEVAVAADAAAVPGAPGAAPAAGAPAAGAPGAAAPADAKKGEAPKKDEGKKK